MRQSVVLGACDTQKHRTLQNYWACKKQKRKVDVTTWRQIYIQKEIFYFKLKKLIFFTN